MLQPVTAPGETSTWVPSKHRAGIEYTNCLAGLQVCINLGIVCAYAIGYPYEGGAASIDLFGRAVPWWRVMFAAALGPCLLQVSVGQWPCHVTYISALRFIKGLCCSGGNCLPTLQACDLCSPRLARQSVLHPQFQRRVPSWSYGPQ